MVNSAQNVTEKESATTSTDFFVASPFRSSAFLVALLLLLVLVISNIILVIVYWKQLSFGGASFLLGALTWLGAVSSMVRAFRYHERIRDLFVVGLVNQVPEESPLHVALDVAKSTMLDGLFYTFSTMLVVTWLVFQALRHGCF
jgi:hypothetical protein